MRAILALQLSVKAAALLSGLSGRSVHKWPARFRAEGVPWFAQSRFATSAEFRAKTPAAQVAVVLALRRSRLPGLPDRSPERALPGHRLAPPAPSWSG